MNIEQEFNNIVAIVNDKGRTKMTLSNEKKLEFYKYYKQATVGDCNISIPWPIYFEETAKWKAWSEVKGLTKEEAMQEYINLYNSVSNTDMV
jgi:diazepam-binding inhibitor (GABA receptor modulating acyl-CoA-binding protein)